MPVTVDRRLWLTRDEELVEDGDESAFRLWATKGQRVSDEEAERVGYKAKGAPENKMAGAPDDKVACPVEGCDYEGTERGLKIHTARSHD